MMQLIHPDTDPLDAFDCIWKANARSAKHPAIDRIQFIKFLVKNGFGRMNESKQLNLVRMVNQRIESIYRGDVKAFVKSYLESLPAQVHQFTREQILETLMENAHLLFSESQLEFLPITPNVVNPDTKHTSFMFFQNSIIKVDRDTAISEISHSEFPKTIWASSIIKHQFELDLAAGSKAVFARFIKNVSGHESRRESSLRTAIGYLIHMYKHPAVARAVVLMDEKLPNVGDQPQGRTGKSLIGKAIEHIREMVTLGAQTFSFNKTFCFQDVELSTQIINFNDAGEKFQFQAMFPLITDSFRFEKKHIGSVIMPFNKSPKFMISTNYVMPGVTSSFAARRHEVEFAPYYTINRTVEDDFGHLFFNDWDAVEWNKFYNFMILCCLEYLCCGLQGYDKLNVEERRYMQETSPEFVEFAESHIKVNMKYEKRELLQSFKNIYEDFEGNLSTRKFVTWLKSFARFRKLSLTESKGNSRCFIEFSK